MRRFAVPMAFAMVASSPGALGAGGYAIDRLASRPPVVWTAHGPVRGLRARGAQAFLGIPYAAPPVGALRFGAPVPPAPWREPLDATSAPPRCAQDARGLPLESAEDCLYLSVHTPDPRPAGAPVLVWIHGGAFVFGEGLQTDGGTAGDRLAAEHGLVVVSMNYRLGPFGFLAHEALRDADGASGNQGLHDQIAALRWVRDNVARFGGDPDDVTLAGESAGGTSVCAHLVSPESAGLFHRAIVQSGPCDVPLRTQPAAEASGARFARRLGCESAACLREKSTSELVRAAAASAEDELVGAPRWFPSIDGRILPGSIGERVRAGAFHRVPVLLGWNADEGTLLVRLRGVEEDLGAAAHARLLERLARHAGAPTDAVVARYPAGAYPDRRAAFAHAYGDARIACPARRFARSLAEHDADVFVYRFEYPDAPFHIPWMDGLGAYHAAEIQYVFGHPASLLSRSFRGDDLALHRAIASYWTRFAAHGDPNGAGAPRWPRHDARTDAHLVLDRRIRVSRGSHRDACVTWDR